MEQNRSAVGVFDSGVGGLTVVRRLLELRPGMPIIYFGDTARVPYGTKSADTIRRYAVESTRFLMGFRPTSIVVACNSVSALALGEVRESAGKIPVYGVIEPGAELAAKSSENGRIGVLGTPATISSGAYEHAILARHPDAKIFTAACPLFVPLAEEGLFRHEATRLIAQDYLGPLLKNKIDTLVLGCTHYPMLKGIIAEVCGHGVRIVDSGQAVATQVNEKLPAQNRTRKTLPPRIYVSDLPSRFKKTAELFLGMEIAEPTRTEIPEASVTPA